MIRPLIALTAIAVALPALAQSAPTTPPQRVRSVTLTGEQKCPLPVGDEVVVCSRIPAGDQYRIPSELRNAGPIAPENKSWAAKTDTMDEVGRQAAGLPNTCSPVGSGGHTGCATQLIKDSAADRREGTTRPPRR
ncbi:MAG: hypothetical protein V4659_08620 [Pseudomonadota bacterium]